jgi:hypothetical protein
MRIHFLMKRNLFENEEASSWEEEFSQMQTGDLNEPMYSTLKCE